MGERMKLTCVGCRDDYVLADGADLAVSLCPRCHVPASQSLPFAQTAVHARPEAETKATRVADKPRSGERRTPARIGRYEIVGKAGEGGMGVVYKARHPELNRIVALKVMIAGEHAAEDTIDRFQREARAAAALQHPNIAAVFDVGREHPLYYIVMEFVDGRSLDDLIFDPGLKPEEAARMARDLARALQYAHERNIVHRDIKPGNVLVDGHGTAKLVDFGLAKSMVDDKTLTKTGEIIGTACYMPPEQASGSMRSVDARSDIYSLGAVLYQMLTGRAPFSGDSLLAIVKQLESADPPPPSSLNPSIPRDLETICAKAMAKEKARRYATAGEFANDLQNFLDGAPIQARPSSIAYRATKWARRHPALFTGLAIASVAAAIIGALAWRTYKLEGVGPAPAGGLAAVARAGGEEEPSGTAEARQLCETARYEIEEKAAKYRAEDRKERRQVLERAARNLDEAIRLYPRYADAYYLRGIARQLLAQTTAAAADFDRAIALNARHADAYYARIHIRIRALRDRKMRARFPSEKELLRADLAAVLKDIETLKTLRLRAEKALIAEASVALVNDEYDRALDLADRSLTENRAFADALVVRAAIRQEMDHMRKPSDPARLRAALADCDAAIRSEVNNAEAYRVRAGIRLDLEMYPQVLEDLAEMESIAPDEPQTYIDKALVLWDDPVTFRSQGEISRAINRAIELDPRNATARYRRAQFTLESPAKGPADEKFRLARQDLDIALSVDPSFLTALVLRMVCHLALGDAAALEADLTGYMSRLPPGSPEKADRLRNLMKAFVKWLQVRYNITQTQAIANEGYHLLHDRKYAEAEAKYRDVLRRIEDARVVETEHLSAEQVRELRIGAHYNLACIYSRREDADRALEQLSRALEAGYSNLEHLMEDPDLELVRKHPGFRDLLQRHQK